MTYFGGERAGGYTQLLLLIHAAAPLYMTGL